MIKTINIFLGLMLLIIPLSLAYSDNDELGTMELPVKGGSGVTTTNTTDGSGDIIVHKEITKEEVKVKGHGYKSVPSGVMQYHNCGNVITYENKVYMFSSNMDGFYSFGNIDLTLNRELCIIKLEVY